MRHETARTCAMYGSTNVLAIAEDIGLFGLVGQRTFADADEVRDV